MLQTISEAGFPTVFEQFDWLGDVVKNRTIEERVISCFVGVKPTGVDLGGAGYERSST